MSRTPRRGPARFPRPILDARLGDGSRVAICVPPASPHVAITARRFGARSFSAAQLIAQGALPAHIRDEAERVLHTRRNILVSGGTASGNTTLLNVLIALIPDDNPLDPTTKYFLNRFIYDFYSRRRATVAQNWARSLRFLSTQLANASFRADSQNVALLAAGVARGELQVARVILRIQPNPQQPHSATADFDLVRMEMANEVGRERWTLSLQFQFLQQIPPELIVFNPMGIVITYLQGDRATVTGDQ